MKMTQRQRVPSYAECVTDVLSRSPQPMSVESLLDAVAGRRPLGKGARSAVYRAINQTFQAVPVEPGRFGWLSHLLNGAVFRHPLAADEIRRGFILLDELEHIAFYPQFFQSNHLEERMLHIELFGGPTIHAEASIERKTWSLHLGSEFTAWVNEAGGQGKDDLLIFAKNASAGEYQLRLNLHEMRDEHAIRQNNVRLALQAEELVMDSRRSQPIMPTSELVARLIGRGIFSAMPPADDFHFVLHEYSMLRFRDGIGYEADSLENERIADPVPRADLPNPDSTGDVRRDWQRTVFDVAADMRELEGDSLFGDLGPSRERYGTEQEMVSMQQDDGFGPDDSCVDYQAYLDAFGSDQPGGLPLSHEDFHLLEAELEMLVRLEEEFGHLLYEQVARKDHLAASLYIDPSEFLEDDWDMPGGPDSIGPFWTN
jgi:hypothetical protein